MRRLPIVAVPIAAIGLSACNREPSPEAVLHRYAELLREGRVERAYALTTSRYRSHHDLAAFAAQTARQPLIEGRRVDREVVVTLDGDGGPVVLAGRDAAHLAFTRDPLDAYPHDTPESCLRSFARAVSRDRRDALLRLLSPPLATQMSLGSSSALSKELVELASRIAQQITPARGVMPPIVQLAGDAHARLLLGDGLAITLEEQPTGWQISALP